MSYEIRVVKSRSDLKRFLDLPDRLYNEKLKDPHYVAPLKVLVKMLLGNLKSSQKKLLIASKDGVDVARIGFKVHKAHGTTKLHFGFFECFPGEKEAAAALFKHGRDLFPDLSIIGPFQFRMEDPFTGMLVDGFDTDPFFLMSYNPPYYGEYIEAAGLKRVMDVLAYDVAYAKPLPADMEEKSLACEAKGFSIRWMNSKTLKTDVEKIARIFNDALSDNWGFEELIDAQVKEMYLMFKFFVDHRIVSFVQKDGVDVGCLIMLPNFNPILKADKGRINLSSLYKIFFKKRSVNSVRGYALGILKKYHGQNLGNFLVKRTWDKAGSLGYETGEISWILSNNDSMNNLTVKMGGLPNRKYRIFET